MIEHYYRELLSFLARKVRDRDVAADLTQESFARVYAAERAGSAIHNPRALLYRTARNLLVDNHRRAGVLSGDSDLHTSQALVEPDMHAGPETLEPEIALASRQRFEAMAQTVDSLPTRCREAFILVKFDGLTHAQAADRMGIAVKTVEMQIQIALHACRARMDAIESLTPPIRRPRGRPPKAKSK
ncbi:sigma-70 family RNA polymerase sigma factor [Comamonas composti]|uniref:sigma-70 family RNA polymerase sigma factor n=1 Tax=Comamonas composti TaxID=408558 RepID=UPI0009FBFC88|nr:sigma-70 family RNA polymerase sigma factor [Comamonas composti]